MEFIEWWQDQGEEFARASGPTDLARRTWDAARVGLSRVVVRPDGVYVVNACQDPGPDTTREALTRMADVVIRAGVATKNRFGYQYESGRRDPVE